MEFMTMTCNNLKVLMFIGLACAASLSSASDYTASVPALDVPIAAGAYADVPLTITNTTASTSSEFDVRLLAPSPGSSYQYEIRSPADCGPLTPEITSPPVAMHTRIAPIAAGASTTCTIRVSRDTAEVDSGAAAWEVKPLVGDGFESLPMRFGTFADIDIDAVVLSRDVSAEGIHEVLRVTAHNRSPMALVPTLSIDPWFAAAPLGHVVAGPCELHIPDLGPVVAPGDFLTFAAIAPDATAQCDIDATLALGDAVAQATIQVSAVADGATGGFVHPAIGLPEAVPYPLHFAEVALNQYGLSGSWANPASSSQGVVLNVVPDFFEPGHAFMFGGWFTYQRPPSNGQRWYTLQGSVEGSGEGFEPGASVGIYSSLGGVFGSSQPATTTLVGHAWFRFADCNHGQLYYEFEDSFDHRGYIPVNRLLPNATCVADGGPPPTVGAEYNLVGTWADPSDNAQGLVIDVDPASHVLFAGWFTYPRMYAPYSQRWYTLQGPLESSTPRGSGITIYQSLGGVFNDPAPTTTTPVGDSDITLHDCMHATLTYRFTAGENAGISGTRELQRLGNPPPGCSM